MRVLFPTTYTHYMRIRSCMRDNRKNIYLHCWRSIGEMHVTGRFFIYGVCGGKNTESEGFLGCCWQCMNFFVLHVLCCVYCLINSTCRYIFAPEVTGWSIHSKGKKFSWSTTQHFVFFLIFSIVLGFVLLDKNNLILWGTRVSSCLIIKRTITFVKFLTDFTGMSLFLCSRFIPFFLKYGLNHKTRGAMLDCPFCQWMVFTRREQWHGSCNSK